MYQLPASTIGGLNVDLDFQNELVELMIKMSKGTCVYYSKSSIEKFHKSKSTFKWPVLMVTRANLVQVLAHGKDIFICLQIDDCKTTDGSKCQIPFTYNNVEYNGCTSVGSPSGELRCLKEGNMTSSSSWAYCTGLCPINCNSEGYVFLILINVLIWIFFQ